MSNIEFTQRELVILNCLLGIQEREYQKEQYEMEKDIKDHWTNEQISHYDNLTYLINEMSTLNKKITKMWEEEL